MAETDTNQTGQHLRVGPLTNIATLLRSMNCVPGPVFEAAGCQPQAFSSADKQMSYAQGSALLAACVSATGCNHFGLLLGQLFLLSHIGIAGELARTAPDVGTAIRAIISHLDLHEEGGVIALEVHGSSAAFSYVSKVPDLSALDQVYDLSVTTLCGIMRSLCGAQWSPTEIHLCRRQPADSAPYQQYFRCPVRFNALRNEALFPSEWLRQAISSSDFAHHEQLLSEAHRRKETMQGVLTTEVRDALYRRLVGGSATVAEMSRITGLHERTLHRHLTREGTSFRKLLDEVRQTASRQYLEGTSLPIQDIAFALGYNSIGAFDHAFRRWFDMSPSQWRCA